ncbi:branched-chain amino acid ABC transporter permease [Pseudooceanicola nitratireducens]|jgi:branched-chain amino acid transport system permease protein|uniref:Amino acid/amide ABC transporter membrane protein 2, HAAT family n=1 Tax=Pseudooceanicola nitratireducens TaxID=517719 RepID=A0A1I1JY19_9RHOB|nr:branched-chain amino acid ABC transporter permease [Pseudooceanicola nitratireducens]MBY6158151.1 branched-chain amino acid ABC transporter permease [Pseudooceanicola nitratireducens]SEJ50979.1 branched-chain amino acid transport system permease protein [Pseudooceanicola nitratireducens]SFC53141.1 amino acid/amide ABC transporter membrane protein 2, HAAT family [Pseudooceanicola nitratireducens]
MSDATATLTAPRRALTGRLKAALVLFVLFALMPPLAAALNDPFYVLIGTRILAFAIAAMALDLILGYGAMVSFGHAAYLGFGTYAVAILASWGVNDLVLQILAAIAISAIFALVTGAISLRTKGVYFIMITLAFGQMAFFFFISLSAYGGDDGVALMQRSTVLGMDLLKSDFGLYYTTLAILVALFVLCHRIVGSRFGRVLTGIRENPTRMEAIGYSPFRYQLTAFVISGCITAVAGVMLANQAQFVSPAFMSWHRSGELIVMVVLGGVGTLAGPIAGAVAALLLEEWLGALSEHWKLFFGVFLVLMVLFSPRGITGLLEKAGIARRQE